VEYCIRHVLFSVATHFLSSGEMIISQVIVVEGETRASAKITPIATSQNDLTVFSRGGLNVACGANAKMAIDGIFNACRSLMLRSDSDRFSCC
jgi:hypothetical protein